MDAGLLALLEKAVRDGIASQLWVIFVVAVLGAGLGAFFAAYLKKRGKTAHFVRISLWPSGSFRNKPR